MNSSIGGGMGLGGNTSFGNSIGGGMGIGSLGQASMVNDNPFNEEANTKVSSNLNKQFSNKS